MENSTFTITNQAGPGFQPPNELDIVSAELWDDLLNSELDFELDLQYGDQPYVPQNYWTPGEDYTFEQSPADSQPDWCIIQDEEIVMEESAKMLQEMEDASTSVAFCSSESTPDLKASVRVNPFTPKICKSDLIRCSEIAPSDELDSLDFFAMEYVRALRFLKVKARWFLLSPKCWMREVSLLVTAITKPGSKLKPWRPLAQILALYSANLGDVPTNQRHVFKRTILSRMKDMGELQVTQNKAAVSELLEARKLKMPGFTYLSVKQAIDDDCEQRGSLLLGTIPEFSNQIVRSFSQEWSWVD